MTIKLAVWLTCKSYMQTWMHGSWLLSFFLFLHLFLHKLARGKQLNMSLPIDHIWAFPTVRPDCGLKKWLRLDQGELRDIFLSETHTHTSLHMQMQSEGKLSQVKTKHYPLFSNKQKSSWWFSGTVWLWVHHPIMIGSTASTWRKRPRGWRRNTRGLGNDRQPGEL